MGYLIILSSNLELRYSVNVTSPSVSCWFKCMFESQWVILDLFPRHYKTCLERLDLCTKIKKKCNVWVEAWTGWKSNACDNTSPRGIKGPPADRFALAP